MTVDPNVDYQALLDAEKAKGADANQAYMSAIEVARNQKIHDKNAAGTNTQGYTATYNYSNPDTTPILTGATNQDDKLNSMYAAKQQSAVAALNSAYQQNIADLNNQESKIPATYNAARNTAAANTAVQQAGFNERAAASGLNSGAGSQAALAYGNTLNSNLSKIDLQQTQAENDIATQRQKLTAQYNNAIAQAVSDNDYQKAQALYNEAVRVDNSLAQTQYQQAQLSQSQKGVDLQQQAAQTAQNEYSDLLARQKAQDLAAAGDYSGYAALGWTQDQIAAANARWLQDWTYQHTPHYASSGGSGRSSGSSGGSSGGSAKFSSGGGSNAQAMSGDSPEVDSKGVVLDYSSPYGIFHDIENMWAQGYTTAQIRQIADEQHAAGNITDSQYQMYYQYSGS